MNHHPAASLVLVLAAAALVTGCAPDTHGDLRTHVEVFPAGAPARLTFAGIGFGSPLEHALAVFGDGAHCPGAGSCLGEKRDADFGTTVQAIWNIDRQRAVAEYVLVFEGNPIAIRKLEARWEEVFRRTDAECDERACDWIEDGEVLANYTVGRAWYGPTELMVNVFR